MRFGATQGRQQDQVMFLRDLTMREKQAKCVFEGRVKLEDLFQERRNEQFFRQTKGALVKNER